MLLVVKFFEGTEAFVQMDIRVELTEELTVSKLYDKLCEGYEVIVGDEIENKEEFRLMNSDDKVWKPIDKVKDLHLREWDTIKIG